MPARIEVVERLAELILGIERPHPVRVAIDGVDAAGKTTLADELAVTLADSPREVIRASVDGFHNPKQTRYRLGPLSPQGYYRDSFNYEVLLKELLLPLGPGGDRDYRPVAFDYRLDTPTHLPRQTAPADAVLLFDGIFLQRPELVDHWDLAIFLQVDFDVSLSRALTRDLAERGDPADAESLKVRSYQRYIPGQRLYLKEAIPRELADVVIEYNDLENPTLIIKRHALP
jgi:uridine kinase